MFKLLDNRVLGVPTIDPADQSHLYAQLGPGYTEPVAREALCGYRPDKDPSDMESLGGWREIEQSREHCAECWDEVRRLYGDKREETT